MALESLEIEPAAATLAYASSSDPTPEAPAAARAHSLLLAEYCQQVIAAAQACPHCTSLAIRSDAFGPCTDTPRHGLPQGAAAITIRCLADPHGAANRALPQSPDQRWLATPLPAPAAGEVDIHLALDTVLAPTRAAVTARAQTIAADIERHAARPTGTRALPVILATNPGCASAARQAWQQIWPSGSGACITVPDLACRSPDQALWGAYGSLYAPYDAISIVGGLAHDMCYSAIQWLRSVRTYLCYNRTIATTYNRNLAALQNDTPR